MNKSFNLHISMGILFTSLYVFSNISYANFCPSSIISDTPVGDFLNHADGTVTHLKTGLMWKVCSEGYSWNANSCSGGASFLNWKDAIEVGLSGFANKTDWRLPNIKELNSIVDTQCSIATINNDVFPSTPSSYYWSSTPDKLNSSWYVDFSRGFATRNLRTKLLAVRLVRTVN